MRLFNFLLPALMLALAFIGDLFASVMRPMPGHFHLMPGSPRSIADTRRMGLA